MPMNWNATPVTMVGTAGARNTILSAQRAVPLRLRVTTHVTLVASDAATTMEPAIRISV